MPIQEERESFGRNPLQKQDQDQNRHQQVVDFTPLEQNMKIQESTDPCFFKCQNSLLDNKLIQKKMQESTTAKLLMNAREKL